jgi:hypothetical protein
MMLRLEPPENRWEELLKQAQSMPALRIHRRVGRAALSLVVAILAFTGARAHFAWAEPLTVAPASTSWERFDPTLELPRIYNPDGSLPPDAEMPGAAVMPEAPPAAASPPPDAIDPASASAPSPSAPAIVHGDPPTGPDHNAGEAKPANANDDDDQSSASFPEPDPESALGAPSTLDPGEGIDTASGPNRAAQNDAPLADQSGNEAGNGQDDQNEQVDAPSVVLIPPPYYGPPQPIYGYPYYGATLGRYSYSNVAPSRALAPVIPPSAGFGMTPPPAYRWIGSSPSWSSMRPNLRASRMMLRSFPIR